MLRFLIVAAMLIAGQAYSSESASLMVGMWSKHWDAATKCGELECNERHDLIGVEYDGYFLATYKNTLNMRTNLAGMTTSEKCWGDWVCADLIYGVATGYDEKFDKSVIPFAAPRINVQLYNNLHLQVFGVPGYIVAAGFRYEF